MPPKSPRRSPSRDANDRSTERSRARLPAASRTAKPGWPLSRRSSGNRRSARGRGVGDLDGRGGHHLRGSAAPPAAPLARDAGPPARSMMAATVVPEALPLPWPSAGLRRGDDTMALWQKLVVLGFRSTFDEPSGGVADFFGAARRAKASRLVPGRPGGAGRELRRPALLKNKRLTRPLGLPS
jgi:hypothetical protein